MSTKNNNNDVTAAVEFISKSGNRLTDSSAKVRFIEKNSIRVYSKFHIKNIDNILAVQILILDGERTKVMIVATPYSMLREKKMVRYDCKYKKSTGAEKYMNIHKSKRKKDKEGEDSNGNPNNTADP